MKRFPSSVAAMVAAALVFASGAVPAVAEQVIFTTNTLIACNDLTYEGYDVVVDGCTLTVDCAHEFSSMAVINSGIVTHSPCPSGQQTTLDVTIMGDVAVAAGGMILADGRGFGSASGPGAGGSGSSYGAGAGYGGVGGDNYQHYAPGGPAYGSLTDPNDLGSGGGMGGGNPGGAGGGVIHLMVSGTLTVNGSVTADGQQPSGVGGGGSGGSIWLSVGTLAGSGLISADGGNGGNTAYSGGGGGGRIAIYYRTAIEFTIENLQVGGGAGYEPGAPGTIYIAASDYLRLLSHAPREITTPPLASIDVTFSDAVDPNSFGAEDILLIGPEGTIPVDPPQRVTPTNWRISFPPQSIEAYYYLYIGPHISDLQGSEMDQDEDGIAGEDPTPADPPFTDPGDVYEGRIRIRPPVLYVDDDAPNDPGPGDPEVSDPEEDGSSAHPFDMLQEAIGIAVENDIVTVLPGTYFEHISFDGKAITVASSDPDDPDVVAATVIDGTRSGSVVSFVNGEDSRAVLRGLTIANGRAVKGGGIYVAGASPTIEQNVAMAKLRCRNRRRSSAGRRSPNSQKMNIGKASSTTSSNHPRRGSANQSKSFPMLRIVCTPSRTVASRMKPIVSKRVMRR